VPGSWNALAFVVEGADEFGGTAGGSQVVLCDPASDNNAVRNDAAVPFRFC
jgi:hypothetical protein